MQLNSPFRRALALTAAALALPGAGMVSASLAAAGLTASSGTGRALGSVAPTAAPAFSARSFGSPGWVTRCPLSHSLNDDPIVFPGAVGKSHLHDFFGNVSTSARSTYSSLRSASTTCGDPGDTAAYWAPALYRNGVRVLPRGSFDGERVQAKFYYRKKGSAPVRPFPRNFRMIAGDAHATSPERVSEIYWGCSDNSPGTKNARPIDCSTGIISLHIGFPSCWNGRHIDSSDHKRHVAYPKSGRCPSTHPVRIPRLIARLEYPVGTSTGLITLASGSPATAHADFWNTWNQVRLERLTARCLNLAVKCGSF